MAQRWRFSVLPSCHPANLCVLSSLLRTICCALYRVCNREQSRMVCSVRRRSDRRECGGCWGGEEQRAPRAPGRRGAQCSEGAGAARSRVLRGCRGGEEHSAPRVLPSSPWSWDEGAAQVNFSHPTPFPVDPLKFVKCLISIPFSIPTLLFVLSKYFQAH